MNRAHFLADTAFVGVCLLLLCCAMPAEAGCEAPKPLVKPKPQLVCTCRPMQQARKPVKRAVVKPAPVTPLQRECPAPVPTAPESNGGAGSGDGLRLLPFTLPAPVVLTEKAQEPITAVQATQVADEPHSWIGGPILAVAGPFVSVAHPVQLPVVVPAVPEPHGLALFGAGLLILWRRKWWTTV